MNQLRLPISIKLGDTVTWSPGGEEARVIAVFENPHLGGYPQHVLHDLYHMSSGTHQISINHPPNSFSDDDGNVTTETLFLIQGTKRRWWVWSRLENLS